MLRPLSVEQQTEIIEYRKAMLETFQNPELLKRIWCNADGSFIVPTHYEDDEVGIRRNRVLSLFKK